MENHPLRSALIDAIKSTLDMYNLGLSLVAQRHFSLNHNWTHIRDNTGSALLVPMPIGVIPHRFLGLSKRSLSEKQVGELQAVFAEVGTPFYTTPTGGAIANMPYRVVPLSVVFDVWMFIANVLELESGPLSAHTTRKLVREAFAAVLEEAYQEGVKEFGALSAQDKRELRYEFSQAIVGPGYPQPNPTCESTPRALVETLLSAPCLPWSVSRLLRTVGFKLNAELEPINQTSLRYVRAPLICSQEPLKRACRMSEPGLSVAEFGRQTFGAPSTQLRSVFATFTVREVPTCATERAQLFNLGG